MALKKLNSIAELNSFYEDLMSQEAIGNRQILQPILVIHGDCDDIVPPSDIDAFVESQNRVCLKTMPGADHRFKKEGEMQTIVNLTKAFLNI